MSLLTFINATDLNAWASRRTAQDRLPQLLRRLIHATTTTATHVGFPAGEAVQIGGWDGVVAIDEDHSMIPSGVSVWEMGTNRDVRSKADSDYSKRTSAQPASGAGAIVREETTFIFITPRRWSTKDEWAAERRAERDWADVRAYDADDLEGWLELAPAVHLWLSRLLGKHPTGAGDLEAVWLDWSESTQPPLSVALMFAGREKQQETLATWLAGGDDRGILGVAAESRDEVVALAAAAVQSLPPDEMAAVVSRTLLVNEAEAFTELTTAEHPLTLIAAFGVGDLAQRAVRAGHRVLVPLAPAESGLGTLSIARVTWAAAKQALEEMGLSSDRARELAGTARRSLLSLRRRLATNATVQQPPWASPENGPTFVPVLLLGQFSERQEGDRDALSHLMGNADTALLTLVRWANESDPPVRRVGSVWYMVSKEDAWERLARYFTRDALERFASVACDSLTGVDPQYDLEPGERWAAGIYGKEQRHSQILLKGIADSLAMLGSRGHALTLGAGFTSAGVATRVVRDVLEKANADWRIWASLSGVLPLLAEAAPDVFLGAVEAGLKLDPSPVLTLFGQEDDDSAMFASSPHTGLLCAIETLAWSPAHLGRASRVLATLDRLDPGGRLTNRPGNSLRTIFLPWIPQTSVGLEARLDVIDMLRECEPDAAWRLMEQLLPTRHSHSDYTMRPAWREWVPEGLGRRVPMPERRRHTVAMVERMLQDAGQDGTRWAALGDALANLSESERDAILTGLEALAARPLPEEERTRLWNALRSLLSKHRSFRDADWALPEAWVDRIDAVFHRMQPENLIGRYAWLFSNRPAVPEGRVDDYDAHDEILSERRVEALRVLWPALGLTGTITLARDVERPDVLGFALAKSGILGSPQEEDELLELALAAPERSVQVFGRAFLEGYVAQNSRDTLLAKLRTRTADWPSTIHASALLALPANKATFSEVACLDEAGQQLYWQELFTYSTDRADTELVLQQLLLHGRPHAAVDLASVRASRQRTLDPNLLADILLAAAQKEADRNGTRADSHEVARLLNMLETAAAAGSISTERVAQLEFLYLAAVGRFERRPRLLHRELARNPAMFVEAVSYAYSAEGEPPNELVSEDEPSGELTSGESVRARLSYELLDTWRKIPGLVEDGVDRDQLRSWVSSAREGLAGARRAMIGDHLIGQMLSGAPAGADGTWPAEAVRDLLEWVASDELEMGLYIGVANSRGVVTKDPLDGGSLERGLVAHYEAAASKLSARWPRTAAVLRRLAESYRQHAEHEDVNATLRHDLLG